MNKKIVIVLTVCGLLAAAGAAGMWYYSKSKNANSANSGFGQNSGSGNGSQAGQRTRMRAGNSNFGFAVGKILSKDNTSITVRTDNGGSIIALYSESTKITKIVDGQISDLAAGLTVTGRGVKNDDGSFTVNSLQLRPQSAVPNRQGATAAGDNQKQPSAAPNNGDRQMMPQDIQGANASNGGNSGFINGQIVAVDSNRVTVKSFDGNEQTIVLADGVKISKLAEAGAGDLTEGIEVSVTGSKNADGSITAQMVQIGAGFGGLMNRGR